MNRAPELTLEDLLDIKIPIDLFEQIPLEFCRKFKILPLRLETQSGILSFVFVDSALGVELEKLRARLGWMHLSAFRITQETFESLLTQCESATASFAESAMENIVRNRSVALIEPDHKFEGLLTELLKSQGLEVRHYGSEDKFFEFLHRTTSRPKPKGAVDLPEDENETPEDRLLQMAETQNAVPFRYVVARSEVLKAAAKFSERIWGVAPTLSVSILEENWFRTNILERAKSQTSSEDLQFFIKHEDFYHAALECLQQGNLIQAVEFLERVPSENAYFLRAQTILGKAFLKKKNYNKAVEHFQRAYDYWCEDPDAIVDEIVLKLLYHLAYSFEKVHRPEDALRLYERIAGENPLFREVGARLARVKETLRKANAAQEKKMGLPAFTAFRKETASRYEHLQELGRGGMGIVFRARDQILGRDLALKVLNSHFKHDEKIVETFLREAKSLAALNHLHIVTIFDAGIEEGNYYIAMEYIEGKTVRDLLKARGHFRLSTAISLSKQVLKALSYAHSKKVIHRDITTNNMMLTENKIIKLMDFGLARVVNQLHSEQSIIGGTPYFMSPEQVEGAPIDHRTDIYSFGVCLFEMTTGQVPFPMENPGYHHLHTKAPDARTVKPDLPPEICEIIAKCLEKKVEDRYQTAEAILEDLKKVPLDSVEISLRSKPEKSNSKRKRT